MLRTATAGDGEESLDQLRPFVMRHGQEQYTAIQTTLSGCGAVIVFAVTMAPHAIRRRNRAAFVAGLTNDAGGGV